MNIGSLIILAFAASTFFTSSMAFAKSHSGTITVLVDLSAHEKEKEAEVWIPYPVSDRDQTVTNSKISGDYSVSGIYTDKIYGTTMLHAKWDKNAGSRKLIFSFRVEREEVTRRNFPKKETLWDTADHALFLSRATSGTAYDKLTGLAGMITTGKTTVLEKAKAIYDWTCENTYRDPNTRGCGEGDLCKLLVRPGGKCVDIHSLFVALARAAGVPAREVFGIRMGKNATEDITGYQHCWAEFFLPGYGWVPVDPGDVRKAMLTENLKNEDARTAELRAYFWGGLDPQRVKLSIGRDLILNPPQPGGPVSFLMYPFARVGDRILDWLEPSSFKYTISYSAD